jgi:hypothetical protein
MVSFRRKRYSFKDWLISLSGEDAQIIFNEKTKESVKITFAFIGCFVLTIFIVSFYSSAHFIYQLFNENLLLAIPIGIVWGLMIANIYLLLLYTITPKILKGKERTIKGIKIKEPKENKILANISVGFRIAFVILIAVIIAQPWLITTFSSVAQKNLDNYKQQYKNTFLIQADSILIVQEVKLKNELTQNLNFATVDKSDSLLIANAGEDIFEKIQEDEKFLLLASDIQNKITKSKKEWIIGNKKKTDSLYNELTYLVENEIANDSLFILNFKPISAQNAAIVNILNTTYQKLLSVISEKSKQYKNLDAVLSASNFYIRKIQIINSTFPLAWGMTSTVVFAFIVPIILKYRIRNTSNFYEVKKELEEKIVKEEYHKFKLVYSTVFKANLNIDNVSFFESCIDPPFNTTKKEKKHQYQNQQIFLHEIYKDKEDAELNKFLAGETVSEK